MSKLIDYINHNYSFEQEYTRLLGKQIYSRKVFCPNPLHRNENTAAAAYYKDSNTCYCFVCHRSFGVYDLWSFYDKKSIEDLKASMVVPESQSTSAHRIIKAVKVDRAQPLSSIYSQILKENNISCNSNSTTDLPLKVKW